MNPNPLEKRLSKDYSPFTPGQPLIDPDFFVGRLDEIRKLDELVAASTAGKLKIAFLTGERGIGKSSVAGIERYIAESRHRVVGIHTFLGGVGTLEELVRRVFDRVVKESVGKDWQGRVFDYLGIQIKDIGLFGFKVGFDPSPQDLRQLVDNFVPAFRDLIQKLQGEKRGVFLILDDINGLAESSAFANWFKSLVDEVATSKAPFPLTILIVGLEERRQSLIGLQPSLARVFDVIPIRELSDPETVEFFAKSFDQVNIAVDPDALNRMVRYAGGLPVLAHEIGDAAYKIDTDGRITLADATSAVLQAAQIVGLKHVEPLVFSAIRSQKYREILRLVADDDAAGPEFKRSALQERLDTRQKTVLDNFLTRMKDLGVISPATNRGPGYYDFVNRLHWFYFWMEAQRAKEAA